MSRTEIIEKLKEILLAADDRNRDKIPYARTHGHTSLS